ncbi:hypothetical protein [Leyella stercorea]|uniref:hypothetical protein n=1 Tax=Leyella stercorea TaxID=363265 RepID=UPI003A90768D
MRDFLYRYRDTHRPTQMSASTDADVRIDRRRCPHRPTQMSVTTDADVRIDRRRCPHRPTQMKKLVLLLAFACAEL